MLSNTKAKNTCIIVAFVKLTARTGFTFVLKKLTQDLFANDYFLSYFTPVNVCIRLDTM